MIYHKIRNCNLYGLHELFECDLSNNFFDEMICHKIHIYNLYGLHELYRCVSSNSLHQKMIYHRSICYVYSSFLHHGLYLYVQSILIYYKIPHYFHHAAVVTLVTKETYSSTFIFFWMKFSSKRWKKSVS